MRRDQLRRRLVDAAMWIVGVAMAAMLAVDAAAAARDDPAVAQASWRNECGGCHVAYPPRLLPAASWRALIASLDRHFGTDASLDAATAAPILAYLEANAGRGGADAATTRITETRWFRREHAEVASAVWSRAAIGSRGNCSACHRQAEQDDFSERSVRIPR
jgi:hypothetical protein